MTEGPELVLSTWLWATVLTGMAAWVQGTVGFGFAIVSVPVLALADPRLAPDPQLLLLFPLTVFMAFREAGHLQWRGVGWLFLGRFPGLFLGGALLVWAEARWLDLAVGSLVLMAAVMLGRGWNLRRTPWSQFLAGVFSGTSSMVSGIGGPPVALLYRNETGPALRSTLAFVFMWGLMLTLVGRFLTGDLTLRDGVWAVALSPGVVGGLWLARSSAQRIPGSALRRGVLLLASGAALGLCLRALWPDAPISPPA